MNQAPAATAPPDLTEARAFCEHKLIACDLGLYYSLLFAPAAQRAHATPLYAFWLEVREINDECSDPAVARVKLGWWSEEIVAMFSGRPRHPISRALAPVVSQCRLPAAPFHELLEALVRHVGASSYAKRDALHEHALRTRGRLETLAAQLAPAGLAAEPIAELGALLEEAELLRDAGADARRGRVYLAEEDVDRAGASLDDLRAGRPAPSLHVAIGVAAQRLGDAIDRSVTAFPAAERRALRPLLIAAAIARALLQRMQRRPQHVLRERVRVAPARQLWIAWRTAMATT